MGLFFEQISLFFIFIICGFALGKSKLINHQHTKILSVLGIYVFLPCTVFNAFYTNFTVANLKQYYMLLIVSVLLLTVLVCLSHIISGLLTKEKYTKNVYRYTLVIANYGYMGYAMAQGLYGTEGLLNIVLFALPFSVYTYTAGYCMLTNQKLSFKKLINPVILSILAGATFGLFKLKLPGALETFVSKSSGCMAPISMLLTGITLSEFKIKDLISDKKVYIVSALRLIALPAMVLIILKPFLDETIVRTAVLLCAMPSGLNTIIFPKLIGESCETGAKLAFVSTTFAIVTIPMLLNFI